MKEMIRKQLEEEDRKDADSREERQWNLKLSKTLEVEAPQIWFDLKEALDDGIREVKHGSNQSRLIQRVNFSEGATDSNTYVAERVHKPQLGITLQYNPERYTISYTYRLTGTGSYNTYELRIQADKNTGEVYISRDGTRSSIGTNDLALQLLVPLIRGDLRELVT